MTGRDIVMTFKKKSIFYPKKIMVIIFLMVIELTQKKEKYPNVSFRAKREIFCSSFKISPGAWSERVIKIPHFVRNDRSEQVEMTVLAELSK
jgi:hypothetical protein